MKTIIFLVDQVVNMGPENVVLDICRFIDRNAYFPIIFSLRKEEKARTIEPKFNDLSIEIVHFDLGMLNIELNTVRVAEKIKNVFNEKHGDILHAHCYHPQIIASMMTDVKTITTIHNISGEDFVMKKGKYMGLYMKWRFNRSLSKIGWSIAISDYMMNYYDGMCKKMSKIPNGVSFRRDKTFDCCSFKQKLGLPENKTIIVVTGSISERKNVAFLVLEIKRSQNDFVCLIVGTGDMLDDCQKIVGSDERFRFEGFRNNVSDYLQIADYYISSSKSEGLPLSVLEALNLGVPTLLSDIQPHKEISNNMNTPGVICYPLVRGSLLSTFDSALLTKYDHFKIEQVAASLYSASVMAKEYEKIYVNIKDKE